MTNEAFISFDWCWRRALDRYGVTAPFKIKELAIAGIYPEMRIALLRELVRIVNYHKLYSLSVLVPQEEFKAFLSMDVYRRLLSPYASAFLSAVMVNYMLMEQICKNVPGQRAIVSYLHDVGSPYEDQLRAGHKLIVEWQERHQPSIHTGTMATDSDDNVSALQASDMIAWVINRKSTVGLTEEFDGLEDLFGSTPYSSIDGRPTGKSDFHISIDVPASGIEMLADGINLWLDAGIMPKSLAEMGVAPSHLSLE
jgi:hypothetical protein